MYEQDRIARQFNDCYSFISSILNFLDKYLVKFHKALMKYSITIKNLQQKSADIILNENIQHDAIKQLSELFLSFTQTFIDEHNYLLERLKYIAMIHLTIENLKQKTKREKLNYRIKYVNRRKRRQYLHRFIQQIKTDNQSMMNSKTNLDSITFETINLLLKVISYLPFDINRTQNEMKQINSRFEIGEGDHLHQASSIENRNKIRPGYSNNINDDHWLKLGKNNNINNTRLSTTTLGSISTDQSRNCNGIIVQALETNNSLHLSDISYSTDYYTQNEFDETRSYL